MPSISTLSPVSVRRSGDAQVMEDLSFVEQVSVKLNELLDAPVVDGPVRSTRLVKDEWGGFGLLLKQRGEAVVVDKCVSGR